jgi:hypothetical protein
MLFSHLSGREDDTMCNIGVARTKCSNTQREKCCEEEGDGGKRPFAEFHGSTPMDPKNDGLGRRSCRLKYSLFAAFRERLSASVRSRAA